MTTSASGRTRRRRLAAAALFLATSMGIAAAATGHSAPSSPDVPEQIGDAVSIGSAVLLSE
jgi:hypothetical protein